MPFCLALDLDRVIFDTNAYFRSLDRRLSDAGTSMGEIFSGKSGRKDIDFLHDTLAERFGGEKADEVMFGGIGELVNGEVRAIAEDLLSRDHQVFVVSVGNKYQLEKLRGFLFTDVFVVGDDREKVEKVQELGADLFVDDKRRVVEDLRALGTGAYQATWFLDEEHRRGAMGDALARPAGLRREIDKLLNPSG